MPLLRVLRGILAAFCGYVVIAAGTTFVFQLFPRGNDYAAGTSGELFAGSLGAFLSGIAGGLIAATLGVHRPILHAAGIAVFIVTETAWLLTRPVLKNPWWFDAGGSALLVIGALCGGLLYRRLHTEPV